MRSRGINIIAVVLFLLVLMLEISVHNVLVMFPVFPGLNYNHTEEECPYDRQNTMSLESLELVISGPLGILVSLWNFETIRWVTDEA